MSLSRSSSLSLLRPSEKRPVYGVKPAIFDLTDAAEAASCRPCPESLRGSFSNPAMQGSLGSIIWTICYLTVLIGLSAYGIHRYVIIYLFLKNRKASRGAGRPFRAVAEGDDAAADLQRGLCC